MDFPDVISIISALRALAEKGHDEATFNLACFYFGGYGVSQDFTMAYTHFTASAKSGNPRALMWLRACLLDEGTVTARKYAVGGATSGARALLRLD